MFALLIRFIFSELPVAREESQRLSGADFPERDFWTTFGLCVPISLSSPQPLTTAAPTCDETVPCEPDDHL